MGDQFRPGWHLPPGTWPYSIQDWLQAALPPSGPGNDPGPQNSASSTRPPTGGLLAILGEQNAPWEPSTSGLLGAALPPASGGYFGSPAPPANGWSSGAPHWLQTAMPFGMDFGPPPSWSEPRPQAAPLAWDAPTLPNLPAPSLANLDPSSLYWPQTVRPFDANGSNRPLWTPPAKAPSDAPPQEAPLAMWDSATLPIPPELPPVLPPTPPNGSWNEGSPSLWEILAGSTVERPAPPAVGDLASIAAHGIPAAELNPAAPDDGHQVHDAITTALAQPHGLAAAASWPQHLGRSPMEPAVPPGYVADARWTSGGTGAQSDPRIISDVTPDNDWTPGARYANNSNNPRRASGPVLIGQRWVEPEPGQATRLFEAETRAQHAIARVRELDPSWRPRPSAYESIEGLIRAHESEAAQAHARLREVARLQFPSEVPIEKQLATQRWSDTAREIAQWLVKNRGNVIEGASWLFELEPAIEAHLDEPKALDELRRAVSNPEKGYDIHHLVEKTSAEEDGFPKSMIHGPDNLVRIPRFKHWEITGWYMTKNKDYQGLPPREHLRGRPWAERVGIGLDALILHGVLKR